jgi:hypothetical protein
LMPNSFGLSWDPKTSLTFNKPMWDVRRSFKHEPKTYRTWTV